MEVDHLVGQVLDGADRYLVGISGIPGAGKSTLAKLVADQLNRLRNAEVCLVVGMDGWHYTRAQLDLMADPKNAHARRGAAFTFDAEAFVKWAEMMRTPTTDAEFPRCSAPSFSHADKDPVEAGVCIEPWHKIVLVEGLYCNLDAEPWSRAALCWDLRWFVELPIDQARSRLIRRHLDAGLADTPAEAAHRADTNDLPNGAWIRAHTIDSVQRLQLSAT